MLNIKKIKPVFTSIITTMDKYDEDNTLNGTSIIDTSKAKGTLKEFQKVVAVGSLVREVKEGDMVCINPSNYAVKKHQEGSLKDGIVCDNPVIKYNFNTVEMDGKDYLLLQDRDISYIIEDYEEIRETKSTIDIGNKLIV